MAEERNVPVLVLTDVMAEELHVYLAEIILRARSQPGTGFRLRFSDDLHIIVRAEKGSTIIEREDGGIAEVGPNFWQKLFRIRNKK